LPDRFCCCRCCLFAYFCWVWSWDHVCSLNLSGVYVFR
jgi:hypothetical protein